MSRLRKVLALALAAVIGALVPVPALAQQPFNFYRVVDPISANAVTTQSDSVCALVKYVGSTAGKPTVEVAAGGDMTFKIAGSVDTTTGWTNAASNLGVFDLSTPDATVDTMGELVNLVNTLPTAATSNWRMVLVNCLASDLTNNTLFTLTATDAAAPGGVALIRDESVASATSIFSAQAALIPPAAQSDIRFFLNGSPVGNTTGSKGVNANPFAGWQPFVQNIREKITSSGTVALFEVLGVSRSYDGNAKVSETVRTIWSATGAATTVEGTKDFNTGPLVGAPGELIVVRQRTATDLTATQITANGYIVRPIKN